MYGSPTLDEHSTLRLISHKYSTRAEQDQVIADIKLSCCGRGATESTYDRIKKRWRRAHQVPITPRVPTPQHIPDAVELPPHHIHPFFEHKKIDEWGLRFVGTGKTLNRLEYKPLVVWGKKGRMGKTERAKALGRHTYCRGALDHEKIHAGMQQGTDVLILDNIKWHVLFNSDLGRALAEGQDSVSWIRRDGERITTRFTAPVIILNNKKCKAWGPNNKAYWRKNLQWVRVRKPLFDRSKTINTGVPPATSPIPPPSSPQPLLTSALPPLPPSSSSCAVMSPTHAPQSSLSSSPAPSPALHSAPSSTPVHDRLCRKVAPAQLEALLFSKANITPYARTATSSLIG